MKLKLMLEDMDPGPLTGKEVEWKCWRLAGACDRRRLEGPCVVVARTWYLARQAAALRFDACDPLAVEAELVGREGRR